jgi:TRAP transporter 4TM/12TM fusion protein
VEATASAGGQIMPPIMGAGAFIMSEWLNIPYSQIAIVAIIPALLYFAAVLFSVDAQARLHGLAPLPKEELPTLRQVFDPGTALPCFGSILVMILLLFHGYTPTSAGATATVVLVVLSLLTRLVPRLVRQEWQQCLDAFSGTAREVGAGLVDAGRNLVTIAAILGCAGLIVTVLSASGIAVKFSSLLISIGHLNLFGVLVLTAILCILLGMDVPTTAAYVLASSVAVGVLSSFDLPVLTAHMFIFYFAILSAITPPVCASVYAAATIARENFWRVALEALRIGTPVYFIPFMMIYRPALMLNGSAAAVAYDLAVTLVAVFCLASGMNGYYFGRAPMILRAFLILVALSLFFPSTWMDVAGLVLAALAAGRQIMMARRSPHGSPLPSVAPSPAHGSPREEGA